VPIAGILLCLLLMFSLPWENWVRLGVWLAIGFIIYFAYSRHRSLLNPAVAMEAARHGVTMQSEPLSCEKCGNDLKDIGSGKCPKCGQQHKAPL
jgi:Zn finger protein HypA/HybF involved in hydrogenase expression